MTTIGMKLTIREFSEVTAVLDAEEIYYEVWNAEEVWFGRNKHAEVEVKKEDFDRFKKIVDSVREKSG